LGWRRAAAAAGWNAQPVRYFPAPSIMFYAKARCAPYPTRLRSFATVKSCKPPASRPESVEMFFVCQGFKSERIAWVWRLEGDVLLRHLIGFAFTTAHSKIGGSWNMIIESKQQEMQWMVIAFEEEECSGKNSARVLGTTCEQNWRCWQGRDVTSRGRKRRWTTAATLASCNKGIPSPNIVGARIPRELLFVIQYPNWQVQVKRAGFESEGCDSWEVATRRVRKTDILDDFCPQSYELPDFPNWGSITLLTGILVPKLHCEH
jgi:hypothetical protein